MELGEIYLRIFVEIWEIENAVEIQMCSTECEELSAESMAKSADSTRMEN